MRKISFLGQKSYSVREHVHNSSWIVVFFFQFGRTEKPEKGNIFGSAVCQSWGLFVSLSAWTLR